MDDDVDSDAAAQAKCKILRSGRKAGTGALARARCTSVHASLTRLAPC
jgi:hypothetical protein